MWTVPPYLMCIIMHVNVMIAWNIMGILFAKPKFNSYLVRVKIKSLNFFGNGRCTEHPCRT
jgi:uncharacterized membrane protein YciS (DUF1049 family)